MPFMRQKIMDDFKYADQVGKGIVTKQIHMEDGIESYESLVNYVREDLKQLDENARKELDKEVVKLNVIKEENKKIIKQRWEGVNPLDNRDLRLILLEENFKKLQRELLLIQGICFKIQVFDR